MTVRGERAVGGVSCLGRRDFAARVPVERRPASAAARSLGRRFDRLTRR